MKIARIETFLFDPGTAKNLLFCRVETDDGLYGWGEAYVTLGKEPVIEQCLQAMAKHVIGRSPFNIRHTGAVLFNDLIIRRSSAGFFSAWSAVEIALWDIIGKAAGQPVYNLLGGASREKVRVYANGWADEPGTLDEVIARAVKVKEQGYRALKFGILPGPWRTFIHKEDEDYAVQYVKLMREALGPEMELMVEMSRRVSPSHAIRIGRRIAEYDITWYEEPCLADNIELVAEVRRNVPIPIVTGETLYTKEDFLRVFEKRAADIINPDVCGMGGITALMEVAAMAQPHAVGVAPHNNNSTLAGLAATVHVCATIPNFIIAECFINRFAGCDAVATQTLRVENGWIDLPTTPGLGIDIDVEKLRAAPYKSYPPRGLRHSWEEYPRKNYAVPQRLQGAAGVQR